MIIQRLLRATQTSTQIGAVIAALAGSVTLITSLILADESGRRMESALDTHGQRLADEIAKMAAPGLLGGDEDAIGRVVDAALLTPGIVQIRLTDRANRHLIAKARPQQIRTGAARPPDAPQIANSPRPETQTLRFTAPIPSGAGQSAAGYAHIEMSAALYAPAGATLRGGDIIYPFGLASLAALAAWLMTRRILRPVNRINDAFARMRGGEKGVRMPADGPRDIAQIASAVNRLSASVEERERDLTAAREEMVHTAMMKTQFAATVSHEARTPMTAVVGTLDIMRANPNSPQMRDWLEIAWTSSRSLLDVMDGLLDYSKMEAGKLELDNAEFELDELLRVVIAMRIKPAQQKGLRLGHVISPNVPPRIRGDQMRLRQVLLTLVGNAVQFTERGEIDIRVQCTEVDGEDITLQFSVQDTGIGISETLLARVFDPYSTANSDITRHHGGSGLSLSISKQLVTLMGGEITVKSLSGKGSVFTFTVRCKLGAGRADPEVSRDLTGLHVLIVDATDAVRASATMALTPHGAYCKSFPNGAAAMAYLRRGAAERKPVNILITDLSATDERGNNLASRVRQDPALTEVRVILLDVFNPHQTVSRLGPDLCTGMPFRPKDLIDAIETALADAPRSTDRKAAPPAPASESGRIEAGGRRIMIVDDNRTSQTVAQLMLKEIGVDDALCVTSGQEAIDKLEVEGASIVLLDCSMPLMDGFETTEHIREFDRRTGRRTVIIAMTANAMASDRIRCLDAGMDDFLPKPLTIASLNNMMLKWLGGTHAPDSTVVAGTDVPDTEAPVTAIDWQEQRRRLGGVLEAAVRQFLADTPRFIGDIEKAVRNTDRAGITAAAHSLRGSSMQIGANHIAELAGALESEAQRADASQERLQAQCAALNAAVLAAREEMEAAIKGRQHA